MKISVVVPAFNEEKLLGDTLQSIRRAAAVFAARNWSWELIVCNNNSTDATEEVARREGAIVVFEPVNQIARARNTGAAAASGDWLIFVDADSHPSPELFADVCDTIAAGRCLAGGVTVKMDVPSLAWNFFTGLWNVISRVKKWCAGSFIFCETATFRAIKGFSHNLFVSEELDLSDRLKKEAAARGLKVVILTRHPLITSGRKRHLYGHLTHLRFLLRVMLRGRTVIQTREECGIWYDGRR